MEVKYPDTPIPPDDSMNLQKATKLLEATISTTSTGAPAINATSGGLPTIGTPRGIKVTWGIRIMHGRPLYVLTLSDGVSEVSTEFYPSDLWDRASPPLLPFRMARLWGDLLEKRSHKQLEELMKLGRG